VDTEWLGKHPTACQIGYPGAIESGMIVQRDPGLLALSLSRPNEIILLHTNPNMTKGTSGGAWIANFSTGESADGNIVVGVTSFGNPNWPGITFGPYFRQENYGGLFDCVSRDVPNNPRVERPPEAWSRSLWRISTSRMSVCLMVGVTSAFAVPAYAETRAVSRQGQDIEASIAEPTGGLGPTREDLLKMARSLSPRRRLAPSLTQVRVESDPALAVAPRPE
jgi:hypothetical protein